MIKILKNCIFILALLVFSISSANASIKDKINAYIESFNKEISYTIYEDRTQLEPTSLMKLYDTNGTNISNFEFKVDKNIVIQTDFLGKTLNTFNVEPNTILMAPLYNADKIMVGSISIIVSENTIALKSQYDTDNNLIASYKWANKRIYNSNGGNYILMCFEQYNKSNRLCYYFWRAGSRVTKGDHEGGFELDQIEIIYSDLKETKILGYEVWKSGGFFHGSQRYYYANGDKSDKKIIPFTESWVYANGGLTVTTYDYYGKAVKVDKWTKKELEEQERKQLAREKEREKKELQELRNEVSRLQQASNQKIRYIGGKKVEYQGDKIYSIGDERVYY